MDSQRKPIPDDLEALARRDAMRKRALIAREAAPPARRAVWEAVIMGHLDSLIGKLAPRVLAFCWPFRAEADCREWVERWLNGNATRVAALPVVVERDAPLVFRRWKPGMELALDQYGIAFPVHGEEVAPDVALVPLNAFDARGYRLGYGGGYFDRTLATMQTVAVGVGFELGRETDVLPQAHDHPMHWLVTEAGVFPAARG
ncbi:MAG: 5-formyltetrahydrofolate cyclo-ligase [Azoarcus sp.]|jgi:5,10-methenyltetrahydrofolate synthetase|nr:5-formyltetrahydrofolate cyclo-ligase [Azoarcus sp.]